MVTLYLLPSLILSSNTLFNYIELHIFTSSDLADELSKANGYTGIFLFLYSLLLAAFLERFSGLENGTVFSFSYNSQWNNWSFSTSGLITFETLPVSYEVFTLLLWPTRRYLQNTETEGWSFFFSFSTENNHVSILFVQKAYVPENLKDFSYSRRL